MRRARPQETILPKHINEYSPRKAGLTDVVRTGARRRVRQLATIVNRIVEDGGIHN
jgi:hypothetical protein